MKWFFLLTGVIMHSCISINLAAQEQLSFRQPQKVKAFKVKIADEKLTAIRTKLAGAKLPRQIPSLPGKNSWQPGADSAWLENFRSYWLSSYDWRKEEAEMNNYPQFIADIDGYKIHFFYAKREGKNPLPLVLTHGWPGSFIEFFDVIDKLTHPSKYGGSPEDAFTLVIPSLP